MTAAVELVAILCLLWDRRVVVALGLVLAVGVAAVAGEASGAGGNGGFASIRLVMDTRASELVGAAPRGAETLPSRAALLADALAADQPASTVARAAGVREPQLTILGPAAMSEPPRKSTLVEQTDAATSTAQTRYVAKVYADHLTPIISIHAYAPNARRAERLANAVAAGLRSLLLAADPSRSRGFVLERLGGLRPVELTSASRRQLVMVAAAFGVFGVWCASVVLGVMGAERLRRVNSGVSWPAPR